MKTASRKRVRWALTAVAAAAFTLASSGAWALGLGRLSVQSALGESLRAEIDVTSLSAEEADNLRVRIAAPDAYRSAGVDYNAVLPGTRAVLLRRPDGRPYLSLTSDRVVQEPFVDVILEMSWSTGRLVREYTLLFDPPTSPSSRALAAAPPPITSPIIGAAPSPPAPAAPPRATAPPTAVATRPAAPASRPAPATSAENRPAPPTAPVRAVAPPAAEPARVPPANAVAPQSPPVARSPAPSSTSGQAGASTAAQQYRVRPGDTLSGIATKTQRPGTSLDQMLVSLYRGNPQAFVGDNMNRLKSGVMLGVPSAADAQAVPPAEARGVIQAQSADFGSYRQRLAGAVPAARTELSTRQASGQVQATVDDRKQPAVPLPDKLTLSKGAAAAEKAAAEERLSKDRERRDSATRVAELSKNVDELSRLSGGAAAARGPTTAAPAQPVASATTATAGASPASAAASQPGPAALPGMAVTATEPPAAPPVVAVAPAVVAAASFPASAAPLAPTPSAPALAQTTARPTAPASAAAVPAATAAPAVAREPTVVGSLLDDNALAFGLAGGLLALLAGLGIYRFTRRAKTDSGETSFLESRLQPDSFFGASGGQRIDTRETAGASSSMNYSLSQLDAIGDVDPVAEADVYLAYGRDLQAEEILKEAMRSTPERMAIRTKLLEVYAKRRDTKGFELLATQLYALTNGAGDDWAKAQEMGRQIDPDNALYQPGGGPTTLLSNESGRPIEPLGASTMPQTVLPSPSQFDAVPSGLPANTKDGLDLDLDLDVDAPPPVTLGKPAVTAPPASWDEDDLTTPFAPTTNAAAAGNGAMPDLPALPASADQPPPTHSPLEFDLSSISLDLDDQPGADGAPADAVTAPAELLDLDDSFGDSTDDPLSRKLELAEEFRQIGDVEGARDLLQEVATKGSGTLKTKAQGMLDTLS